MKIVIVDNETGPREAFRTQVLSLGYDDVLTFDSVESARSGLENVEQPFLVLLDHDFGSTSVTGYDLCRWLRETHPIGLLLPIVYLTGRLAPDRYLKNEHELPFNGPTAYLAKAHADAQLEGVLSKITEQFDRFRVMLDDQAARRALATLSNADLADDEEALA